MTQPPTPDRSYPSAKAARTPGEREKLKRAAIGRGLVGLANDTKWDELLAEMRPRAAGRQEWRFSYRYKCVTGYLHAEWDVEWFYHLPFPLMSVEWMDIWYLQYLREHRLPPRDYTIDHSPWLEDVLRRIGLEYQKGQVMIRVFGYAPRDLEWFDVEQIPAGG